MFKYQRSSILQIILNILCTSFKIIANILEMFLYVTGNTTSLFLFGHENS